MASKAVTRNVLLPLSAVTVLLIGGNIWVSREMKTLEQASVLAPSAAVLSDTVTQQTSGAGTVEIDPANDPMAPVNPPPAVEPSKPQASNAHAEPFYEPATEKSSVLVQ